MGLMIPSLDFDLPLMAAQRAIRTCHILNVCVKRHPRTLGFLIFFLNVDMLFFFPLVIQLECPIGYSWMDSLLSSVTKDTHLYHTFKT